MHSTTSSITRQPKPVLFSIILVRRNIMVGHDMVLIRVLLSYLYHVTRLFRQSTSSRYSFIDDSNHIIVIVALTENGLLHVVDP